MQWSRWRGMPRGQFYRLPADVGNVDQERARGGAPRRPRPARAGGNPLYSLGRASTLARRRPPKLAGMDAGPSGDDRGQGSAAVELSGMDGLTRGGGLLAEAALPEGKATVAAIIELPPGTSITALWSLERFRCRVFGRLEIGLDRHRSLEATSPGCPRMDGRTR